MNWSYIAGFFDGEGCIHQRKGQKSYQLLIKQKDRTVLDGLKNFTEMGKVYFDKYGKGCYVWVVCYRKDIYKFLREVLPFLIVKKDKATEVVSIISIWKATLP